MACTSPDPVNALYIGKVIDLRSSIFAPVSPVSQELGESPGSRNDQNQDSTFKYLICSKVCISTG